MGLMKRLFLFKILMLVVVSANAFTINGNLNVTNTAAITYGIITSTGTFTSGISVGSNGAIFQGNVGIGINPPISSLDVRNATVGNIITIGSSTSTYASLGYQSGYAFLLSSGGDGLALGSNSPQDLFIAPNGTVGIGTTSPVSQLDVESTGNTFLTIGTNSTALDAAAQYSDGTNYWDTGLLGNSGGGTGNYAIYNAQLSKFPLVISNSNDNVGVGTTLTVGPNATAVELCRCTAGTLTGMYISCTVGTIATFCTSSVETNISGQ